MKKKDKEKLLENFKKDKKFSWKIKADRKDLKSGVGKRKEIALRKKQAEAKKKGKKK